jgi:hypothetical protein
VANNTYSVFSNALTGLEDAIVEFASTGENSFKQLLSSIQTEIFRLYIVRPALASIFGGAGGATGGGGMFGSYFAGVPSGGYSGGNSGGLFGNLFSSLFGSFLGGFDDGGISRGKGLFYAGTDELHIPLNRLNSVTNNKSNVTINLTQVIGDSKNRRYRAKQLNKTERQLVRETTGTLARFT